VGSFLSTQLDTKFCIFSFIYFSGDTAGRPQTLMREEEV